VLLIVRANVEYKLIQQPIIIERALVAFQFAVRLMDA